MSTGAILMTYGAPRDPAEVAPYLARVRGGKAASDELVAEMTRRYERIGWSPLIGRTIAQAQALEHELGPGWRVAAGMRYARFRTPRSAFIRALAAVARRTVPVAAAHA